MHAIPSNNRSSSVFVPEQCERFDANRTTNFTGNECPDEWFGEKRLSCDRWVFDESERTIVNDVCPLIHNIKKHHILPHINFQLKWLIMCPENQWKLALVGTIQFAGTVVGCASLGVLADRYEYYTYRPFTLLSLCVLTFLWIMLTIFLGWVVKWCSCFAFYSCHWLVLVRRCPTVTQCLWCFHF